MFVSQLRSRMKRQVLLSQDLTGKCGIVISGSSLPLSLNVFLTAQLV